MSGIAGILSLDERPPEPKRVDALRPGLARRGRDGTSQVFRGPVAMLHAAFWTDREPTAQPILRTSDLLLAWDGRLDDARELESPLANERELHGTSSRASAPDLELLAAAYLRWGVHFVRRVVGDFALALWDSSARRLVLARDPFGTRPLYWAKTAESFVWGSTLSSVLAGAALAPDVDDEFVADFLAGLPAPDATPYRSVRAVPRGALLVLENGGARVHSFWRPEEVADAPPLSDPDVEERTRELFDDALRCRLRGSRPIVVELSGGLDSSTIACVADRLVREGGAEATELTTVTWTFEESPTADERAFARHVEERIRRPRVHVGEVAFPLFERLDEPFLEYPAMRWCFRGQSEATVAAAARRGARAVLSGFGGDDVMIAEQSAPYELVGLLASGRLAEAWRTYRLWRTRSRTPLPRFLWQAIVQPTLPNVLRRRLGPVPISFAPAVSPAFERRMRLSERLLRHYEIDRFALPDKRLQLAALKRAGLNVSWQWDHGPEPIENRFPYLHRPLVEFLLSLPMDQFVREGEPRSLHRRAFGRELPERIARRKGKRGPDEAVLRGLAKSWPRLERLLARPLVCERGYADRDGLKRFLSACRAGGEFEKTAIPVKLLALEAWLRQVEGLPPLPREDEAAA